MKRGLLVSVLLTLLVCFGAFAAVAAKGWKPLLGLDLRGGLSVVYCPTAKTNLTQCSSSNNVSKAKLNEAVNILDARVQGLGVGQPNIGVQGDDIVVQLPGIKDPRHVKSILGKTAQLYYRPLLCYAPPYTAPAKSTTTSSSTTTTTTGASNGSTTTTAKSSSTTVANATTTTTKAASVANSPSSGSSSSTTSTTSAAATTTTAGAATTTTAGAATTTTAPAATTTTTTLPAKVDGYVYPLPCPPSSVYTPTSTNGTTVLPYPPLAAYKTTPLALDNPSRTVILTEPGQPDRLELGPSLAPGSVISNAYSQEQTGIGWVVVFDLTSSGNSIFNSKIAAPYFANKELVGDDLDGIVVSAASFETANFAGSGQITGNFTATSAGNLAIELKYGALPIRLAQETSEVVSASLGSASLKAGVLAGLLGLLLVMAYTIFYYRALGIVVVLGLVSTGALLYAIISFLSHESGLTLDLSGITGLIVSVGITVDSYVVYFERLKDEVRAGRSIRSSVDRGFKSAYRTILSADAVSFIGAAVLYLLSIGAVRGFAFMLGLSTILDVATAYVFTRPLVILLGRNRVFTEARGLGVARGLAAPSSEPV